ncbi:hypothetical protein ACFL35_14525 [Candidatus Riflebacteria bacterium]
MNKFKFYLSLLFVFSFPVTPIFAYKGIVMEGPEKIKKGSSHLNFSYDTRNSKFNFGSTVFEDDQSIFKFDYSYDIYDWVQLRAGGLSLTRENAKFSPFKDRLSGFIYGMKFRGRQNKSVNLESPFEEEKKQIETDLASGEYYFGFNVGTFSASEIYQMDVLDLGCFNNIYVVVSHKKLTGEGLLRVSYDIGASVGFIPTHSILVNREDLKFDASKVINLFAEVEKPIVSDFSFIGEAVAYRFTNDFRVVEDFTLWNAGIRYRYKSGFIDVYATDITGAHLDPGFGVKASLDF